MISFGGSHAREPVTGPFEPGRLRDRNEPEIPLGEPLLEEDDGVVLRLGNLVPQDQLEAFLKLGLERHRPGS